MEEISIVMFDISVVEVSCDFFVPLAATSANGLLRWQQGRSVGPLSPSSCPPYLFHHQKAAWIYIHTLVSREGSEEEMTSGHISSHAVLTGKSKLEKSKILWCAHCRHLSAERKLCKRERKIQG